MSSLSSRLQAAADRIIQGQPVADIGADHGALVCSLVAEGCAPSAIAVEVAAGPIERLRTAVDAAGLAARIEVRCGDGLDPLHVGEARTVVICGMGGQTMQGILARGLERLPGVQRLVLSPHTAAAALRRALVGAGWTDVDGCWVEDRGHHYPVAAWERGTGSWSEADYRWGRSARSLPGSGLCDHLKVERQRLALAHASAQEGRGSADPEVVAIQRVLGLIDAELARLA